jgi:hypothetical protein
MAKRSRGAPTRQRRRRTASCPHPPSAPCGGHRRGLHRKAKSGAIRTRGGARYKPSVLRGYEADLTRYLYPDVGRMRLSELRRRDVQHVVDQLVSRGDLSGYKVRDVLMPLRVIVRHALEDDEIAVNPRANLRLPEPTGRRDRVATK